VFAYKDMNMNNKNGHNWLAALKRAKGFRVTNCQVDNDSIKVKSDYCHLEMWLCLSN
jgi:hypothetical protein